MFNDGFLSHFIFDVILGKLLNVRPKIKQVNGTLAAVTAAHIAVLTLGLKLRSVIVDPKQRAIRIHTRYFWLFPTVERIPFDMVSNVIYNYADYSIGSGLPVGYQEYDMFTVQVRAKNGQVVLLCKFFGNGSFVNDSFLPDWFFMEEHAEAAIIRGSQEDESRAYADVVSRIVGVPIENE